MTPPASTERHTLPPGPRLPRPLTTALFLLASSEFLRLCGRRYGDCFTLRVMDRTLVLVSDPDLIKEIFTGDPELLHAGEGNIILAPLLGMQSVLLLDGADHLRQRRLMLPAFHGQRMQPYERVMHAAATEEVARWPRGESFPVLPAMQAVTLEVIMRAVFGIEDGARLDRLRGMLRGVLDVTASRPRMLTLALARSDRSGPWVRLRQAVAAADEILFEVIRDRRADPAIAKRDDVLSLLVQAVDEDGGSLSESELRDELMTLLLAGHETTATALAWTFEQLARHPQVLSRLRGELRDGGDEYLDAVIKEALRMRPVIPAVARRLTAPMRVRGHLLAPGTVISPSIYLTHRRPDLYPQPDRFLPERFLDRAAGTYTWIPFGGGIRRCLGASFALFEMRVVLRTVLETVELRREVRRPERITRRAITFAPARGARIAVDAVSGG